MCYVIMQVRARYCLAVIAAGLELLGVRLG